MPVTTSLQLDLMDFDSNPNSWGVKLNDNQQNLEDAVVKEGASISVTSADVTLSDSQNLQAFLKFSGALTGNRSVNVRAAEKWWIATNLCTGAFSLTVKTLAGTGVVLRRGETKILKCDGTNVSEWAPHAQAVAGGDFEWCGTAGGTANALTLTTPYKHHALKSGMKILFIAALANTAAVTIAITPQGYTVLTAVPLVDLAGNALGSGALQANALYMAAYNEGTASFHLLGSAGARVTNGLLADMAEATIKGRAAGAGTGAPQDLTPEQAAAVIAIFDEGQRGVVPGPTTAQVTYNGVLRADGWGGLPHVEVNKGALTTGTVYTEAHNLPFVPSRFEVWAKCTTAENGFAVGDYVQIGGQGDGGGDRTVSTIKNATSCRAVTNTSGLPTVTSVATRSTVVLTAARWDVIFFIFP